MPKIVLKTPLIGFKFLARGANFPHPLLPLKKSFYGEGKVSSFQQMRQVLTGLVLALVLTLVTACGNVNTASAPATNPANNTGTTWSYAQLERGNSASGQQFGQWVVQTAKGLIQDAYVRDNNKLGVVISSQVRPNEVKDLAKSLTQGFHKNFPNQDLTVLIYAPDKKLILTTKYDTQSNQIEYQAA